MSEYSQSRGYILQKITLKGEGTLKNESYHTLKDNLRSR